MGASMIDRTTDWVRRLTGVYRGANRPFCEDVSGPPPLPIHETESEWLAELNALPCSVVNRLSSGGVPACPTGSLVWEAVVSAHGFQVPSFSAAMNRDEVLACLDLWGSSVYVKPAGVVHSGMVLSEEDARAYADDPALDWPALLAPVCPGQLVSLFVVGEHVVASVVRSVMRSRTPVPFARLGPSLLQRCSDLVLALGLVHAECLLSLSADGQITCLDVVASPNYWTCPREAQRQVVGGLVRYLAESRDGTALLPMTAAAPATPAGDCAGAGASQE